MDSAAQSRIEHVLLTSDGVSIAAVHYPQDGERPLDLVIIVVPGITGHRFQDRVRKVTRMFATRAAVIAIDLRGHGASGGKSTVGNAEVLDVDAAVGWARELGYRKVATVGFSMGGSVVVRQAALSRDVDAVVTVSGPAFWYYKGTKVMRRVHRGVETRLGRLVMKRLLNTAVDTPPWPDPPPIPPVKAVAELGSIPLLIVHGDRDRYFPVEHPEAMFLAANSAGVDAQLWLEEGFGHAENAASEDLLQRILAWVCEKTTDGGGR